LAHEFAVSFRKGGRDLCLHVAAEWVQLSPHNPHCEEFRTMPAIRTIVCYPNLLLFLAATQRARAAAVFSTLTFR
jgi:hypothetical protein